MLLKRNEAMHAIDFPDFDQALALFNYYGERNVRNITLQDYFFTPRRATASASIYSSEPPATYTILGEVCTRCGNPITRHAEFFVDTAKRRSEADLLCRPCLVVSARQVFRSTTAMSDTDAALAHEVQRLREMKWSPRINVELADRLLKTRTFFS
ncbi:hypothetical protein NADE_002851 [Nannochloris sp. 'desiccata']|nr:hypothetical protein KSW81_001084 [Chlorella desiccata (nom. nud.)]KAH7620223.1 hypothetical protein NADE_002851 [Chlorella desiccata (nom. nud.)]